MAGEGFYYPQAVGYSDRVLFLALNDVNRDDGKHQNLGYSEDYKLITYTHGGGSNYTRTFDIILKISNDWGTDEKFSDLDTFIRTTVNSSEKGFSFIDENKVSHIKRSENENE